MVMTVRFSMFTTAQRLLTDEVDDIEVPVVMVTHSSGQTLRGMQGGVTTVSLVPGDWRCGPEDGASCLTDGSESVGRDVLLMLHHTLSVNRRSTRTWSCCCHA